MSQFILIGIDLAVCLFIGWTWGRVASCMREIQEVRRVMKAMLTTARAWPLDAPHYFTWIVTDGDTEFLTSKVAYETEVQAGLMGYTIWRDYARDGRRDFKIYVQRMNLESGGETGGEPARMEIQ